MLQRIRVAAALATALAAGTLVSAPAAATAAQAPAIARVNIDPGPPIDVSKGAVKATFSFSTKGAEKAGFTVKAPGDVSVDTPVSLTPAKRGNWTKWTGTKTFDAKAVGKWGWKASAAGDGDASRSGTFEVVRKLLDTKIANFGARPGRVDKGDRIKVSGRLLAGGKGYSGQSVAITFRERGADAYREAAKVTTGRGGWFSARVRVDSTGWWRAQFAATSAAGASVSDSDRVDVKRSKLDSRISRFDARPEPVEKGDRLRLSGSLRIGDRGRVSGQRVEIFFKAAGSDRWTYVTSDRTSRHGRFDASATARSSGWWRAEYDGARGVKGTVSRPDYVTVKPPPAKADTRLIAVNAYPEPVERGSYLRIRGLLQIDDDGSWEGHSGRVSLYFKPLGSRTWQYVKSAWAGDSGRLHTKAKAWRSGHWRFVFRGDDDAYGDTSGADYVRVRR
ncbi:hypothetical protein E1267_38345 [Nonomuraea longispora]|uniref:Htaa domain protein n=1 Tax=Nonomuraea longispora TaxID=1848320 RepID=A0A4V2XII6_9ACTN|nr:hypothetical protein [Nonomuraea longispora]TDB98815.1 hypothetical protein E1267_38345 [Nonomuraea longispora]